MSDRGPLVLPVLEFVVWAPGSRSYSGDIAFEVLQVDWGFESVTGAKFQGVLAADSLHLSGGRVRSLRLSGRGHWCFDSVDSWAATEMAYWVFVDSLLPEDVRFFAYPFIRPDLGENVLDELFGRFVSLFTVEAREQFLSVVVALNPEAKLCRDPWEALFEALLVEPMLDYCRIGLLRPKSVS